MLGWIIWTYCFCRSKIVKDLQFHVVQSDILGVLQGSLLNGTGCIPRSWLPAECRCLCKGVTSLHPQFLHQTRGSWLKSSFIWTRVNVPFLFNCFPWNFILTVILGKAVIKEYACWCRRRKRCRFNPWVRKIPWRRGWQPTPVFLPQESHGQRSLMGYSSWGHKGSQKLQF